MCADRFEGRYRQQIPKPTLTCCGLSSPVGRHLRRSPMAAAARIPSTIELDTRDGEHDPDTHSLAPTQSASNINDVSAAPSFSDTTVPDGGFGWIIVLGCAVQTFIFYGITSSWGIFQAALVDQELAGSATLSFVGSVTVTCAAILALAGARILRLLGSRTTSILGILLLATGQILSGFTADNIGGLFVTAGLVTGIGNCLCFMVRFQYNQGYCFRFSDTCSLHVLLKDFGHFTVDANPGIHTKSLITRLGLFSCA
jgi:hypothetical protein